jgi:hypothetical protein
MRVSNPLLLQPSTVCAANTASTAAAPCRTLYDTSVFIAPVPASNRDLYRIGVGLDFVQMIKDLRKPPAPASPAAAGAAKQ